ncbi:hypothetical protein FBU30_010390 [Linnemannia zychae]|nr:hypothetical protein FBU30_010390 [Linnemannia zychae]
MACLIDCTAFLGKANTVCQNIRHVDIFTTVPTIGKDPIVDDCLCQQSMLGPMQTCATCQFHNNIVSSDRTMDYFTACNNTYPDRRLFLPPNSGATVNKPSSSASKTGIMLITMLAVSIFSGSILG